MLSTIPANFHTHTSFCDGSDECEAVILEALSKGFSQLGFSGHMDPDVKMDYPAYDRRLRELQEKYHGRIDILRGVELDTVFSPECAPGAEYRIGSTHFVPVPGSRIYRETKSPSDCPMEELIGVDGDIKKLHEKCQLFFNGDFYRLSKNYYEFEAETALRTKPAFIGHFDLITRFNDLPEEEGGHFLDEERKAYLEPALEALSGLVSAGIPFELNLGAVNRGRKKNPYPAPRLLKELHDFGGRVILSADAHQKELLDGCFNKGLDVLRAAGFQEVLILKHADRHSPLEDARNTEPGPGYERIVWAPVKIV